MSIAVVILEGPLARHSLQLPPHAGGAEVVFEGIVRPSEEGRAIRGLNYEAYEPMAQKALQRLSKMTVEKFGLLALHVHHSKGFVANHEISFLLGIASPHRKEALAAMDYFIDQMKADVPLWKTAVFAEGTP